MKSFRSSSSSPSSHSPRTKLMLDELFIRTLLDWKFSPSHNFLLDVLHCLSIMSFSHFSLCCVFQFYFITWARRRGGRRRNFLACGSAFWSYWFFSLVILFTEGVEFHTFLNLYVRWNLWRELIKKKNRINQILMDLKKKLCVCVSFEIVLILWMNLLKVWGNF